MYACPWTACIQCREEVITWSDFWSLHFVVEVLKKRLGIQNKVIIKKKKIASIKASQTFLYEPTALASNNSLI
jgi:hypothetical protein